MSRRKRVREIPFRKIVPNMITSGSVLCGMLSLILTYNMKFLPAAWLLVMAVFFDYMDGKVARSLGGSSAFGVELDSLADALSFGAAPAFLFYAVYIGLEGGTIGAIAVAFFALCGVLRLARFNVTHVVGPFQGIPIPAAGLGLVAIVIARLPLSPGLAMVIPVVFGSLMISTIPYGNLKLLKRGNVNKFRAAILFGVFLSFMVVLREKALLASISIYAASGPIGFDWGMWLALDPSLTEDEQEQEV